MTKAELIKLHGVEWYEEYKARKKAEVKFRYANNPEYRERQKARYANDPIFRKQQFEYKKNDLNSSGKTKNNIRNQSSYILFDMRHHIKLDDYEIHHCFGYEDPSKFIYIPKSLHDKIHRYLRGNNIDANSNHYDCIKYMINECEEYTYISI